VGLLDTQTGFLRTGAGQGGTFEVSLHLVAHRHEAVHTRLIALRHFLQADALAGLSILGGEYDHGADVPSANFEGRNFLGPGDHLSRCPKTATNRSRVFPRIPIRPLKVIVLIRRAVVAKNPVWA
jgi:hypothetical protein